MAFSREYFARGQCLRPLYARFKECHLSSYSTERCSNRTFCRACVRLYLSPPLIFSSLSLNSLALKAKVLDLHPPGNNTLLQLKIFGLKIYLTRSYCCTFPFCFVFFCVSPVHQNAHNLKFAFKQPSVVLNAKCKCSTTMKHQTAVFHQLIYSFLIDMKLLLHPAKVIR